jgi:outer membrane murein-binding lipoprotein Lpp
MKRAILPAFLLMSLLVAGCATRDYVKQQMEPLVARISKLEAENCCKKAEQASKRCERAAKRCEKAFELQQHK